MISNKKIALIIEKGVEFSDLLPMYRVSKSKHLILSLYVPTTAGREGGPISSKLSLFLLSLSPSGGRGSYEIGTMSL